MNIAVITGASSGLGKEFFLHLDKSYDEVWLIARRREKMEEIAKLREDIKSRIIPMDLMRDESLDELDLLFKESGACVGLLINNAGFGQLGYFDEMSTKGQMGMVRLNDEALVGVTSVALKYMNRGSQIINICSIASFAPNTRMTVYSSTKAFIMSFSRALRVELKRREINVLAVCPGPMATEFLECAGIQKGSSKTFDTLPYCDAAKVAEKSLRASEKGKAVYTPKFFYKFYHCVSKLLPTSLLMKMAKT